MFTVDIVCDTRGAYSNVPMMTPYANTIGGHGIYMMPEVGTRCVVCWTNMEQPVILGFIVAPDSSTSYRSGRDRLGPGDYVMETLGGAKMKMLAGGIVQIQSSPNCRRSFLPNESAGDTIRDISTNYVVTAAGGQQVWHRGANDRFTTFSLRALQELPESPDDPGTQAMLQMGYHKTGQIGDLAALVPDRPGTEEDILLTLGVSEKSSMMMTNRGDVIISNVQSGNIGMYSGQSPEIPTENFEMKTPGTFLLSATGSMKFTSGGQAFFDVPTFITSGKTYLGGGGLGVARILDRVWTPGVKSGGSTKIGYIIRASNRTFSV
jgi:hypothetical protein